MSAEKYALPLPDAIKGAPDTGGTTELLRLWWKDDHPELSVRPALTDMRMMGQVLAEVSWHMASAYAQLGDADLGDAVKALRQGWVEGHANGDAANPGVVK